MTAAKIFTVPAGASAEARATKVDRMKYLESWSMENPLQTIEAARAAVRAKYGISLGTKVISDTLRAAKGLWEAERKQHVAAAAVAVDQPIQLLVAGWADGMRRAGVRLIELLPDGRLRMEFATPAPPAS